MREIKFRAWDFIKNEMMETTELSYGVKYNKNKIEIINQKDCFTFMQYTGLKDKNGVEIYEGDIVRVVDDVGYYGVGKVIFNLCSFCFEWIDDTESNIEPMITVKKINLNQEVEVIGNIYENKELLND